MGGTRGSHGCVSILAAVLLLGGSALCSGAAAQSSVALDPSLGVLGRGTWWFGAVGWHHVMEIGVRASFTEGVGERKRAPPLAAAAGARLAMSDALSVPVEVFALVELTGQLGEYLEPACGLEIGLSGLTAPDLPARGMPDGVDRLQRDRAGPVYLAFVATPLRIHIGQVRLVALDFKLGSSLNGSSTVVGLGYLRVEYRV